MAARVLVSERQETRDVTQDGPSSSALVGTYLLWYVH